MLNAFLQSHLILSTTLWWVLITSTLTAEGNEAWRDSLLKVSEPGSRVGWGKSLGHQTWGSPVHDPHAVEHQSLDAFLMDLSIRQLLGSWSCGDRHGGWPFLLLAIWLCLRTTVILFLTSCVMFGMWLNFSGSVSSTSIAKSLNCMLSNVSSYDKFL